MAIYQDLLDRISKSYLDNDFDTYALMLRVPHDVGSFNTGLRLETRQDLRLLFDNMRARFVQQGITDYLRTCLAAGFNSPTEILGAHETRLMNRTQVVEQPFPSKSILRLENGRWWVVASDNAIDPKSSIGRVLEDVQKDRHSKTAMPSKLRH